MIQLTPDEIATVVLARNRRRTWVPVFAGLTWALWLGAAVWLGYYLLNYDSLVRSPERAVIKVVPADRTKPDGETIVVLEDRNYYPRPGVRQPTPAEIRGAVEMQTHQKISGLTWAAAHLTVILSLVVLALLATVSFLTASRRATLRQIQASLAAIAGQLAELQRPHGTIPPTAGG